MNDFLLRLGACFVVLWTPFFFFSSFRGHPIPNSALFYSAVLYALIAALFALVAGRNLGLRRVLVFTLLVSVFLNLQMAWFSGAIAYAGSLGIAIVFWFLRDHLTLILLSVFTTVLVTSGLGPSTGAYVDQTLTTHPMDGDNRATPDGLVIHIILDGFAGIEGIPEDQLGGSALRQEVVDFFRSYGFTLFPRAISEYAASRASISGILNFDASPTPERHYRGKRPFILEHNAYFDALHARQYEIHVTQSTYMDFCAESTVPVASCWTYRYDGTDWLRASSLGDFEKMTVLLGMVLNRPGFFETSWKAYAKLRGVFSRVGLSLPVLMAWDGHVAPITAMSALDHFRETVVAAPRGTAHFAHLLVPHSPYIYDANCELRGEPLGWLSSHPLYEKDNTPADRTRRYSQYFGQVRCTLEALRPFFDELEAKGRWADAEVILHGDHGARIYQTAPRVKNRERLTPLDLADGFSTLFAVKPRRSLPLAESMVAVVGKARPVSRLLAMWAGVAGVESGSDSVDPAMPGSSATSETPKTSVVEPEVYLEGQDDEPWVPFPWQRSATARAVDGQSKLTP